MTHRPQRTADEQCAALLDTLRALEVETLQAQVRADPVRLGRLLHRNFLEIARSGVTYSRDSVLREFSHRPPPYRVWSQDFKLELLTQRCALLTYKSAHISADGTLERHTLRASLWQRTSQGWRVRFHQGTPMTGFERNAT